MTIQPRVALSHEFLANLSRLPATVHSKVLKWTVMFQTNPTSSAINYEKILKALDPNLKSVRIDRDYRGIIFKPPKDDVYVLLHVAHHDEAYQWAARRQIRVHPMSGALQILVTEEKVTDSVTAPTQSAVETETLAQEPANRFFSHLTHDDMAFLGVPEELYARVESVCSADDLLALARLLNIETYEALGLLADGFTVAEVREDIASKREGRFDPENFKASLDTPESRSSFYVAESEDELVSVLNSPLAEWRIFLHPKQRRLARMDAGGPVRVLGGAGTGKTVLAMHRARWLAENYTLPGKRVLVTTFTRNLAGDIAANLETLCSKETLSKIEVTNLDRWVRGFLQDRSYDFKIVYELHAEAKTCWDRALAASPTTLQLPADFYEKEWEQVVAANGITTLDEYRTARRVGRGTTLTRKMRDEIWPVFEDFRARMTAARMKMVDDAYRDAATLIAAEGKAQPYSAIVVDETQDFGPMALRLLRAMIAPGRSDLFFVGDGHQRIYRRNRAAMSKCGINIVGRSHRLNINYRTTDQIRRAATALLEGCAIDDLDDGTDTSRGYRSVAFGPAPTTDYYDSLDMAAAAAVGAAIAQMNTQGIRSVCIITPTISDREMIANSLQNQGQPFHKIEADTRDKPDESGIRLATMHRAKGLEFDSVVVLARKAAINGTTEDETERKLLYVALTRARKEAKIVGW